MEKLFNFQTCICQCLYRELGSVLSIYVLRIALNHDVANFAIAVDIALVLGLNDLFTLICTGLSCISTYISC